MHNLPLGIAGCPSPVPYQPFNRRIKNLCQSGHKSESVIGRPFCGCPWQSERSRCNICVNPGILQTRILYPPKKCVPRPCNFVIPPVPCMKPTRARKAPHPFEMDWHVDEPGPNDSYGLNGLTWYDWQMEYHNKEADKEPMKEGMHWPLAQRQTGGVNTGPECTISTDFWPDMGDRSGIHKIDRKDHYRPPWCPGKLPNQWGVIKYPPPYGRYCRSKDKPLHFVHSHK